MLRLECRCLGGRGVSGHRAAAAQAALPLAANVNLPLGAASPLCVPPRLRLDTCNQPAESLPLLPVAPPAKQRSPSNPGHTRRGQATPGGTAVSRRSLHEVQSPPGWRISHMANSTAVRLAAGPVRLGQQRMAHGAALGGGSAARGAAVVPAATQTRPLPKFGPGGLQSLRDISIDITSDDTLDLELRDVQARRRRGGAGRRCTLAPGAQPVSRPAVSEGAGRARSTDAPCPLLGAPAFAPNRLPAGGVVREPAAAGRRGI